MSKRPIVFVMLAAVALVVVAALPGTSVPRVGPGFAAVQSAADWDQMQARLEARLVKWQVKAEEKLARLREYQTRLLEEKLAKLDSRYAEQHEKMAEQMAREHARWAERMAEFDFEEMPQEPQEPMVLFDDEDSGWLGVTVEEVSGEKAKELKLSAERGVYIREISAESPAAKAGLKAGDVITDFNGQRVEGTVQFRRLVRETPAGRAVQLTVWREGRSQTISVQLGSPRDRGMRGFVMAPRDFDFRVEVPRIEPFGMLGRTPQLGIQADDLSGQLGSYFGAPDGEGVLVREVLSGSPAEKAGLKAGDVIIKVDGERIRSTSDLRSRLRDKRESKTVSLGVLRKGSETSLSVEIEQPQTRRPARTISRRTSL